jgi:hypothetical protein
MLPCGNDSHVELGIALAHGAEVYILGVPDRPGVFYHGATVCRDEEALLAALRRREPEAPGHGPGSLPAAV